MSDWKKAFAEIFEIPHIIICDCGCNIIRFLIYKHKRGLNHRSTIVGPEHYVMNMMVVYTHKGFW